MSSRMSHTLRYAALSAGIFTTGVCAAAPTYYTDGTVSEQPQTSWPGWGPQQTTSKSSSGRAARSSSSTRAKSQSSQASQAYHYDTSAQSADSNWYNQQVTPNTQSSNDGYYEQAYEQAYQTPAKQSLFKRLMPGRSKSVSYQQVSRVSPLTGTEQVGKASWYGHGFHGGKTANGERYDMNSMTAAHRSLPFGTVVKVTNLNNGRECVVRINNRGPYLKGRIIDMSKAAASQLGFVSRGICNVKMQVLGRS